MISFGIETGDPELLKQHRSFLGKIPEDAGLDLIKRKVYLVKKYGIRVKGLFMMGLPGETEHSVDKSMKYVFSLPLDDFNLAKLTPYPGAPLYKDLKKYGIFSENWELMNSLNFVFIPKDFTRQRLDERYKEFCRSYYKQSKIFFNYIKMFWKSPNSWFRFIKSLPDFIRFTKDYKKNK